MKTTHQPIQLELPLNWEGRSSGRPVSAPRRRGTTCSTDAVSWLPGLAPRVAGETAKVKRARQLLRLARHRNWTPSELQYWIQKLYRKHDATELTRHEVTKFSQLLVSIPPRPFPRPSLGEKERQERARIQPRAYPDGGRSLARTGCRYRRSGI